jgi:alpha-ketoglutarate-dependent taurine dioxygenase
VPDVSLLDPIGAEIRGLDLARIDDAGFALLHAALLEHGLLLLPDQHLDDAAHVAVARRFGELEALGREMGTAHPEVIAISNVGDDGRVLPATDARMTSLVVNEQWHTDSSFREVPSTVSVFRAEVVPAEGGATFWASLREGWLELDERERKELEPLRLVHDYARSWERLGVPMPAPFGGASVTHPLVRRHPETGERCLFLSDHAWTVEGWPALRGRALIERLLARCTRPERVHRHRWRPGDVAIWDNRCMVHRTEGFDEIHPRVMYHVRVAGTGPVEAASRG